LIYLVKSKFSKYYTSINTIEYYEKLLQCSDIPWYYCYYDYTLNTQNIDIPCNSLYTYVSRQSLNTFDKQLYYLHLQAVKLKKRNDDFYWRVDPALHYKFSVFWETVLREKNDKIN
jgi:hypothetical protein